MKTSSTAYSAPSLITTATDRCIKEIVNEFGLVVGKGEELYDLSSKFSIPQDLSNPTRLAQFSKELLISRRASKRWVHLLLNHTSIVSFRKRLLVKEREERKREKLT